MYNKLKSTENEGVIFLTRWRSYDFFLSYNKKTGKVLFYTCISNIMYIVKNEEVINAIIDTCLNLVGHAALAFCKNFDNINYMGTRNNKVYWALTSRTTDANLSRPAFVSFDGKTFSLINNEEKKCELLYYFNTDQYKCEQIIDTGKW